MALTTSENGIKLIKKFEGCVLSAYRDSVGVITIGYGWTKPIDGQPLRMGMTITQAKADSLLRQGLKSYENNVNKYDSKYHWNQNQFDALVSFAYNIGSIDKLVKKGSGYKTIAEISATIPKYCNAGGRRLPGLVNRRNKEKELFDKLCGSTTNTSSASTNTNTFNQHLHDLQWAINQDELVSPKLVEDGKYGNKSKSAIQKCCVKNGSKGNVVSWVQCRVGAKVDGKAGTQTVEKIKEYQKRKGLTADGVAGFNTITSILRDFGVPC